MVLADADDRVVQAGKDLLSGLAQSNPELEAHAEIHIEGQDNQDQKARADRIRFAMTAKGVFVADYQFSDNAPPANQLRYCKIAAGALQPQAVMQLLTDVDGNHWSSSQIQGCENSNKIGNNHYEIWFADERIVAQRQLLALENEWKAAKASGN